jgi:monooxygenase
VHGPKAEDDGDGRAGSEAEFEAEHLDVLIVGAGLSGVGAGHYLKTNCPWARFAILEARDAIGGTWDLFRFPGIRSDSDMYTLGYSFRPWDGEKTIADGDSIRSYIRETARASGIEATIRFRHRVTSAAWSTEDARWHVTVERGDTGESVHLTAGFFFSCAGYYRYDRGYVPEFPGLEDFEGTVVHPQFWPEDLDYDGKQVVVIGSGSTAVTMIPAMAETAGHVIMLQRSPSYIASLPGTNPLSGLVRRVVPGANAARVTRWVLACMTQAFYQATRRWPERMRRFLIEGVRRQLPDGFDVDTHFTPRYDPWDQRLCVVPDGDLFVAIKEGRASVVTDHITTFTHAGLLLESGTELAADIVVTATGLELQFAGGIQLSVDGRAVEPSDRLVYKGALLEGVPNFSFAFGYTNASWTLKCDLTCQYVSRLLNEMRSSGMRQCTPVNADDSIVPLPFLDLTSGYIQRAVDRLPKRGSRFPWQVHQSYFHDYRVMKMGSISDKALVFSNPVPFSVVVVSPAPVSGASAIAPSAAGPPPAAASAFSPSGVAPTSRAPAATAATATPATVGLSAQATGGTDHRFSPSGPPTVPATPAGQGPPPP